MSDMVQREPASLIESVIVKGDLAQLTASERVNYYQQLCRSIGVNPLTRPLEYITLNGKLTLYARKDCTDQLRRVHSVSIDKPDIQYVEDWIVVSVVARMPQGRTDSDIGVVSKKDMRGDFGNAVMKCVTKAKRRVTLSICGLGMLDETEIETIPDAKPVQVNDRGAIEPPKPIKYLCSDCNKDIYAVNEYTAAQVADLTKRAYRVSVCDNCHQIRKAEIEAGKVAAKELGV